jgi:hypothetical protein
MTFAVPLPGWLWRETGLRNDQQSRILRRSRGLRPSTALK